MSDFTNGGLCSFWKLLAGDIQSSIKWNHFLKIWHNLWLISQIHKFCNHFNLQSQFKQCCCHWNSLNELVMDWCKNASFFIFPTLKWSKQLMVSCATNNQSSWVQMHQRRFWKFVKFWKLSKQFVKTYQSFASLCNMFKASYNVHNIADYLVISNHFRYSILVLMLLKHYHIPKIGLFTSVKHYRILNYNCTV